MPIPARPILLALILAATPLAAGAAPTSDTACDDLVKQYDEAQRTAEGLVSSAVEQALKNIDSSSVLQRLGLGGNVSPEQALRRGALAALPPTTQNAILIYLLRAGTAMQALSWKGCSPPGSSG